MDAHDTSPITMLAACPQCRCEWRLTVVVHNLFNTEQDKGAVWICQRCRAMHRLPVEGLVTEVKHDWLTASD